LRQLGNVAFFSQWKRLSATINIGGFESLDG